MTSTLGRIPLRALPTSPPVHAAVPKDSSLTAGITSTGRRPRPRRPLTRAIDPNWWSRGTHNGVPLPDALRAHDISTVFNFLRARGWSRAAVATATCLTESRFREIALGRRRVTSYEVLERVAEGLHISRGLMGLAFSDDPEPVIRPAPDAGRRERLP